LISAGADTLSGYLQSLILCLASYPEAQKLAHEEIDAVVGDKRLPTMDDLAELPYCRAVIKEVGRLLRDLYSGVSSFATGVSIHSRFSSQCTSRQ
jgi:cytochrome P450